jgi:DNA invertase Pin-like site-specific DNA recombinase
MLGAIAVFENELRKEHQYNGIVKAKDRGVILGRNAF